ncbi:protein of unknown function [Nitrospira defluvii]|uniref:Uncharacterized protein n=1 Tax=Nitrospira defluvii TaxID=330214 RepID=D8PJB7_9BACT|nr:protein of unknown function [Nitrospira defluvii]
MLSTMRLHVLSGTQAAAAPPGDRAQFGKVRNKQSRRIGTIVFMVDHCTKTSRWRRAIKFRAWASRAHDSQLTAAIERYLREERLSTITRHLFDSHIPHETRGHPSVSEYALPLQKSERCVLFDTP